MEPAGGAGVCMWASGMPQHHDRLELAAAEPQRGPSTSNQGTEK